MSSSAITTVGPASLATQAEQETGTTTTAYVTPGRQQFHDSACKSWCEWQVDGTDLASLNVSSITDTAVGAWAVQLDADMSSASYATMGMALEGTASTYIVSQMWTQAAHQFGLACYVSTTLTDPQGCYGLAFGDQV